MAVSAKLLSGSLNNISSVAITSREYNGSTTLGASFLNTPVALTGVRTEFVRTYTCTEATVTHLRWGYRVVANNGAAINLTIRFYHAHMNPGAVLHPYHATTTAPYYAPRFDYDPVTHAAKGLLVEQQRTNSIRNSTMAGAVAGTPGTLPTNWSRYTSSGLTQQLVEVGTENGLNYIDWRIYGTASGASGSTLRFEGATTAAASTGQAWANSAFLKIVGGSTVNINSIHLGVSECTSDGTVETKQTNGSELKTAIPTSSLGTYRAVMPVTLAGGVTTAYVRPYIEMIYGDGAVIDITLRIAAPQLELGAFSTSFILTTGAAATRAADALSFTIPAGVTRLRYTFDDNSTQDVAVTAGAYTVPTDLNRAHIKRIAGFKS